jgi:hypothetical protein
MFRIIDPSPCINYTKQVAAKLTPCVSYRYAHACPCVSTTPTIHSALLRHVYKFCGREAANSCKSDEPVLRRRKPHIKNRIFLMGDLKKNPKSVEKSPSLLLFTRPVATCNSLSRKYRKTNRLSPKNIFIKVAKGYTVY